MKETPIYFKPDAKGIVDLMFEGKLFKDDITRDQMNIIENHIQWCMQARLEFHLRGMDFVKTCDTFKMNNPELL